MRRWENGDGQSEGERLSFAPEGAILRGCRTPEKKQRQVPAKRELNNKGRGGARWGEPKESARDEDPTPPPGSGCRRETRHSPHGKKGRKTL